MVYDSGVRVFLETRRLVLRRFVAADIEHLVELDSDPEVMRYLSGGAPTPREAIESSILPRFLASYEKHAGLGFWAAINSDSHDFVGWFGLHPNDSAAAGDLELGYRLRREFWGRGYATEGARALLEVGFLTFGATRIFAATYQDNLASRRVMEKLGMSFVRSFHITSAAVSGDTFVADESALFEGDDVEYAITKAAWERSYPSCRPS